jgi:bifunctional non-homologous end joining protein LigD
MLSQSFVGDGPTVFRHAEKLGLEGIVSKRVDEPYPRKRTSHWLKIKSAQYQR